MSYQLITTTTLLQRTLERDPLGMKIPDHIVDLFFHELLQQSSQSLQQIEISLNVNPSFYAKRAYRLWTSNSLSLSELFSDVPGVAHALPRVA